ncbi:glycosyl transferase family A (plasmid) [Neorhizobium sp. SOG26]|uniref:glycosyltransferase family 2 protein n=1 Tax=Neorhizobium sp. SOG26 TaxID=2060726 RepID=UPI000E57869B|nr:glycosyltransferase [Neorhizobium sp. SOG26]AXV18176.1 glycosyl transferase family A [Neorhizobium sp. SOG26]
MTDGNASIEVTVCIPTFRRPEGLRKTLQSLIQQQTDLPFAIVVVENDAANPLGSQVAREVLGSAALPHHVVVEPKQGNCHAINRAFSEAREIYPSADCFLMIDDDEVADPHWLEAMVSTARRTGADIVGGPVVRQFEVPVSHAVSAHALYGYIDGPSRQVPAIHGTGNCLISRKVFETLDPSLFDVRFNFLGGGDMDFFRRCREAGFTFWWCQEVLIHETVAADRASPSWLMRRSVRTGSINYVIDRKRARSPVTVAALQLKNVISLGLSIPRAIAILFKTKALLPATHPILMSFGRVTASLGFLPTPYEASAIPAADARIATSSQT